MQPDVSFVIAAFNAEATLDRAIAGNEDCGAPMPCMQRLLVLGVARLG